MQPKDVDISIEIQCKTQYFGRRGSNFEDDDVCLVGGGGGGGGGECDS